MSRFVFSSFAQNRHRTVVAKKKKRGQMKMLSEVFVIAGAVRVGLHCLFLPNSTIFSWFIE